jgi:UPF0271 protein
VVDINCDVGESYGAFTIGDDAGVMESATSVNVACGFHGGDPRVIERTVGLAAVRGIGVGAHPGFADLVGFGRRDLSLTFDEARTDILYQIGALFGFTRAAGLPLQHVKPHGQLNNRAVADPDLARAIATAIKAFDPNLILVAYGGELVNAGQGAGLRVAREVYADREYTRERRLVSRGLVGAVITDTRKIVARAVTMVRDHTVTAITGETIEVTADTICVHGDTAGAAAIAVALRQGLEKAGIAVRPLAEVLAWRR